MTFGQILFYSGIGLLAATAIVGVLFLVWKPKYTPDNPAYQGMGMNQGVPPMYNGYPTDPLRHYGGQTGTGGRQTGWPPAAPSGQMQGGGTPPVGYGAVRQPWETHPPQENWPRQ